jgi:hypothetical protein
MINEASGTNVIAYKVIGGNSRLVVLDATSKDIGSTVLNVRLVEGGIAIETLDCQSQPEVCDRKREQRTQAENAISTTTKVVSDGSEAASAKRTGPAQPQWIYFRPFPNSPVEK